MHLKKARHTLPAQILHVMRAGCNGKTLAKRGETRARTELVTVGQADSLGAFRAADSIAVVAAAVLVNLFPRRPRK